MPGGRVQASCVAILAAALALHPLASEDVFWHLASGRWILQHRAVPRFDVLTYSLTDHPWTNLQWLTDVGLAAVWSAAGADGLVLAKAAAFAGLGAMLVAAGLAIGAGPGSAGLAASLAILASAERTFERPEIATYVLLAATFLLAMRARSRFRFFTAIAILHALWANLHALAFLGMLMLLLFAVTGALARRHPSFALGNSSTLSPGTWGVAAGISAIALLANPYGIAAWLFPRTLFQRISGEEEVFSRILEFASPWRDAGDPALRWFWILVVVFALSVVVKVVVTRSTRATLGPVLFTLPYLALAFLARRNVPLFAIVAAPLLAVQLAEIARHSRLLRAPWWSWGAPAFALLLAAGVLLGGAPLWTGLWRDRGLGVEPGMFPEQCLQSLERSRVRGPLFNDLDFGGYISWRDPERRTWIDGRLEVAGPERLSTYVQAHLNPAVWERLQSSWKFEALLLEHSSRANAMFLVALLEDGQWQLQHLSPEGALLLPSALIGAAPSDIAPRPHPEDWMRILEEKRGPEPHAGRALQFAARPIDALLRRIQGSPRNAPVRAACRLANACLTLGWIEEARAGYLSALERAPHDPEALFNLGLVEIRAGHPEKGRQIWENAIPLVDRVSRSRFRRALDGP